MTFSNYGIPPQYQQAPRQVQMFRMYPVSNIMEANATPVDNFEPVFFYNRAENVVYMKKMLQDCSAPIQVFKLHPADSPLSDEKQKRENIYENDFEAINEKISDLSVKIDRLLPETDKKDKK